jgi:hypothetical protein
MQSVAPFKGAGRAVGMRPQGIGLPASALGWVLPTRRDWAATRTANGDAFHRLSLQSNTSSLALKASGKGVWTAAATGTWSVKRESVERGA